MTGIEDVLGRRLTWFGVPNPGPGRDDQRPVRSNKRAAEGLNGTPVLLAIRNEIREVVVEGGVDHAVRLGRPAAQTFQVFKIPPMHGGAGGE